MLLLSRASTRWSICHDRSVAPPTFLPPETTLSPFFVFFDSFSENKLIEIISTFFNLNRIGSGYFNTLWWRQRMVTDSCCIKKKKLFNCSSNSGSMPSTRNLLLQEIPTYVDIILNSIQDPNKGKYSQLSNNSLQNRIPS